MSGSNKRIGENEMKKTPRIDQHQWVSKCGGDPSAFEPYYYSECELCGVTMSDNNDSLTFTSEDGNKEYKRCPACVPTEERRSLYVRNQPCYIDVASEVRTLLWIKESHAAKGQGDLLACRKVKTLIDGKEIIALIFLETDIDNGAALKEVKREA